MPGIFFPDRPVFLATNTVLSDRIRALNEIQSETVCLLHAKATFQPTNATT